MDKNKRVIEKVRFGSRVQVGCSGPLWEVVQSREFPHVVLRRKTRKGRIVEREVRWGTRVSVRWRSNGMRPGGAQKR